MVRLRWFQLIHHQLVSSGRNLSSDPPTDQLLSLLTDPLELLTDLLHPPPPTHQPLGYRLTDSTYQTGQQLLIDRIDLLQAHPMLFNRPGRFLPVNQIRTVWYPTDPLWIFLLRRESCRMNWMLQLQIRISPLQKSRETMRGIRSFMGWTHIPDMDTATGSSEDNPFAGPRLQTPGKISVQLPTDEWLCRKLSKLNLTLTDGYPSRSAEAGGLQRDQFLKPPRSQAKWYGCHPQQKSDTTETLTSWSTDSSKLNSGYLRIARQAGIATSPPQSRIISQDTLRKWEKSTRESSVICNQAAGFNRCLMKVQQDMQSQLKVIRLEHKGKSSSKLATATEELHFLMDFNSSICQAMAKSMEHLTDSVFVNMANVTLLRRDSYLAYLKAGIKADTLAAL